MQQQNEACIDLWNHFRWVKTNLKEKKTNISNKSKEQIKTQCKKRRRMKRPKNTEETR